MGFTSSVPGWLSQPLGGLWLDHFGTVERQNQDRPVRLAGGLADAELPRRRNHAPERDWLAGHLVNHPEAAPLLRRLYLHHGLDVELAGRLVVTAQQYDRPGLFLERKPVPQVSQIGECWHYNVL